MAETVNRYYDATLAFGKLLLRGFALALGEPADRFDHLVTKAPSQLRLVHYPYDPDATDVQGLERCRDCLLRRSMRGAVVHAHEAAEDVTGRRANERDGNGLRRRPNAAEIARQHGRHRGGARRNPQSQPVVAVERAPGGEIRVIGIRIGMSDGGDRIARRRHATALRISRATDSPSATAVVTLRVTIRPFRECGRSLLQLV